jgi:hypothetical protein
MREREGEGERESQFKVGFAEIRRFRFKAKTYVFAVGMDPQ